MDSKNTRNSKVEDSLMGPAIYSEGDDLVDQAWDSNEPKQRRTLARRALEKDLDCIDAYVILALHAEGLAETIALLREAVRVGDRLWAEHLSDVEMVWWGFVGTRPFMRALHNLGLAYIQAGDASEAKAVFERMLKLNKNDNQGVRALLCSILLDYAQYQDAEKLLESYPDDAMLESEWTRLSCALLMGREDEAIQQFAEIKKRNKYLLPLVAKAITSGKTPKRSDNTPYIEWGSKNEALALLEFGHNFLKKPDVKAAFMSLFEQASGRLTK